MTYDELETPEEERERFMRKLNRWRFLPRNPRQDVLDDYREAEKADAQSGREEDD